MIRDDMRSDMLDKVAEALYEIDQYAGRSGDYGPLNMNGDIRSRYRCYASNVLSNAGVTFGQRIIRVVES